MMLIKSKNKTSMFQNPINIQNAYIENLCQSDKLGTQIITWFKIFQNFNSKFSNS